MLRFIFEFRKGLPSLESVHPGVNGSYNLPASKTGISHHIALGNDWEHSSLEDSTIQPQQTQEKWDYFLYVYVCVHTCAHMHACFCHLPSAHLISEHNLPIDNKNKNELIVYLTNTAWSHWAGATKDESQCSLIGLKLVLFVYVLPKHHKAGLIWLLACSVENNDKGSKWLGRNVCDVLSRFVLCKEKWSKRWAQYEVWSAP